MKTSVIEILSLLCLVVCLGSCERVDTVPDSGSEDGIVRFEEVARILASLPMGQEQYGEVHDAVMSSAANGYDEEYTMKDLFAQPGSGVGDVATKAPSKSYSTPLRDMIEAYVTSTKSSPKSEDVDPQEFLDALKSSEVQIYWPYSEEWNGKQPPVVTFDPADGSETSTGYRLVEGKDGKRVLEEITVDEDYAKENPVWVVNRNTDSEHISLEMLRRQDPQWGAGGEIVIGKPSVSILDTKTSAADETEEVPLRTLILKEFTPKRNFDIWLAGGSEFFCKIGSVEDFCASTEAEMKLYNPSITDFMVVVRRNQVGKVIPFNAVLVSKWTNQLDSCAFMLVEDDGGTRTSWKCSAEVKVQSKTYGFNIEIPFRSNDDIVWRGQLSAKYLEKYSGTTGHFGDVDITFEIVEL